MGGVVASERWAGRHVAGDQSSVVNAPDVCLTGRREAVKRWFLWERAPAAILFRPDSRPTIDQHLLVHAVRVKRF